LASRSHYVPGRLEPSLTMLPLGSIDSAFSLQSAPSVHVAIARWKHDDTSLQTASGLLTVSQIRYLLVVILELSGISKVQYKEIMMSSINKDN